MLIPLQLCIASAMIRPRFNKCVFDLNYIAHACFKRNIFNAHIFKQ